MVYVKTNAIIYKIARLCKNILHFFENPKIVVFGAILALSLAFGLAIACFICGVQLILSQFSFSLYLRCVLGGSMFFLPISIFLVTKGSKRELH